MIPCAWLALAPALAQPADDLASPAPPPASEGAPAPRYAVNARYRRLWLPRGVLNPWYYTSDETRLPRPDASGHVIGGEFALEPMPSVFSFWAEGWVVELDEGYWDDIESPDDHSDGDWIRPQGLGMIALGANFGHEWSITPVQHDAWLGFAVGGGLGVGIPWGSFERWQPGWAAVGTTCQPASPSEMRRQACEPDEVRKTPAVLPVVDITLALKLHLLDRAQLRVEAGVHDLPFVGLAGGGTF